MNYPIEEIEGIGHTYGAQLSAAGITNTRHLLKHCSSRPGRRATAEKSGLTEAQLLKWANHADLMRISGIGPQYGELLEAAGVDTVKELRNRRPDNLAAKMSEVNVAKRLTRRTPPQALVEKWVAEAKELDPIITY